MNAIYVTSVSLPPPTSRPTSVYTLVKNRMLVTYVPLSLPNLSISSCTSVCTTMSVHMYVPPAPKSISLHQDCGPTGRRLVVIPPLRMNSISSRDPVQLIVISRVVHLLSIPQVLHRLPPLTTMPIRMKVTELHLKYLSYRLQRSLSIRTDCLISFHFIHNILQR